MDMEFVTIASLNATSGKTTSHYRIELHMTQKSIANLDLYLDLNSNAIAFNNGTSNTHGNIVATTKIQPGNL